MNHLIALLLLSAILHGPPLPSSLRAGHYDDGKGEDQRGLVGKKTAAALRAAWVEAVRETTKAPEGDKASVLHSRMQRFLGFVEGRLQVAIPQVWEESVANASQSEGGWFYFPIVKTKIYARTSAGFRIHGAKNAEKEGDRLIVSWEGESVSLPFKLIENEDTGGYDVISCALSSDKAFIAFHRDWPGPMRVICVDRKTSGVAWSAEIDVDDGFRFRSGRGHHYVMIVPEAERILVFGAAGRVIHVESLQPKDGIVAWQFSSHE